MRVVVVGALAALTVGVAGGAGGVAALTSSSAPATRPPAAGPTGDLVVLYQQGAPPAAAHLAIRRPGGTIVEENRAVGLATVRTTNRGFGAALRHAPSIFGVA